MSDTVKEIDCEDDADVSEFIVNANVALTAARYRDALTLALSFHTNGDGDATTEDATEVARTAETFERFLRGDGVAHGQEGIRTCSS